MPQTPLATAADIEARLGRSLSADETGRVEALLVDASAAVRGYTRRGFTSGTSTVRLRARGGQLRLPQRPVSSITSVKYVANGVATTVTPFWWDGLDTVYLRNAGYQSNWGGAWADDFDDGSSGSASGGLGYRWDSGGGLRTASQPVFEVEYVHGADTAPDEIVAVVCSVVLRAFGHRPDQGALQSENIQGYSYSVGSAGAAGPLGLLPDEKATLDRHRQPVAGTLWVA
jgi:hypothetical protein